MIHLTTIQLMLAGRAQELPKNPYVQSRQQQQAIPLFRKNRLVPVSMRCLGNQL